MPNKVKQGMCSKRFVMARFIRYERILQITMVGRRELDGFWRHYQQ